MARRGAAAAAIFAVLALSILAPATGFLSPSLALRGARGPACVGGGRRRGAGPRMQETETEAKVEAPPAQDKHPMLHEDAVPFSLFDAITDPEEIATVDLRDAKHQGPIALRHLYHNSERILVISYVKDKCSMCRVLKPLMEKVINEYVEGGKIHFVQLEVTANKPLAYQAGLKAVPATHFFKRGRMMMEIKGLVSKKGLAERLDAMIVQYGGDEGDEALGEMDREREEQRSLKEATKRLDVGLLRRKPPRIWAPGRTLYPSRWEGIFKEDFGAEGPGVKKTKPAKGVVGEVFNMDALLTDEDEIDDSFFKALQPKSKAAPGWVRDAEGTLIRRVTSDTDAGKDIKLVGRIADGESNLDYSGLAQRPDMEGGEGWPQQVCDDAGCMLFFGEEGSTDIVQPVFSDIVQPVFSEDKSKKDSLHP